MPNTALDRDDLPYKFAFEFVEPTESLDSVFEIEPKQATMGPREVHTFKVTFHSDKYIAGRFRSIVMATPSLA